MWKIQRSQFDKPLVVIGLPFIGLIALAVDFNLAWLDTAYRELGPQTVWCITWRTTLPVAGFVLAISRRKNFQRIGYVILLSLSLIYILLGNRGYGFCIFLTAFWLYDFKIKPVSIIKVFAVGVIVVSFASVFYQLKPGTVREKLDITTY